MNVLLTTSAPPSQTPFSTTEKRPPVGVGFLISVLRDAGHNVFFVDNYLSPSNFLETDYLQRHQIDFVGIYTNTICYRDSLRMFYRLEEMRQTGAWQGKIIAGGPHASVSPETIPSFVNHIVIGEGEYAIRDIVAGKVTERIVHYPSIENLDELPMPAWDYFAEMPYDWGGNWLPETPVFTMNTSRGCPFDCTFCSVGSIWGRRYTYFSAERVVADIEHVVKHHGAKGIYFREDNFTLNKKRLYEFCNLMIERGINIPWVCETRASSLDRETVELMARAGAKGAYIGVESGSQRLLDFMHKAIKLEDVRRAFNLCHEFGINTAASIIIGVPTETQQDLQMTMDLLREIKPTVTWFNVFVGIPKSNLYQYVLDNKLYEYIDDRGLVYLKGHNERVRAWYGDSWNASIPIQIHNGTIINPKISVVMSVYNGERYLSEAIKSIQHQSFNNFEFIIVNDASNDTTAEILNQIDDPRVRVFTNQQNLGLTRSLNKALKHCRGEYIARMDADDLSHPLRFEKQLSFLERHPSHALVGSSYYMVNETGTTVSLVGVLTESAQIKTGLKDQNWFGHGSVMMRKSALDMAGGYDEEFRYAQDYDLWLRLSELYDVANIQEPLYFWRNTEHAISRHKAREQQHFAELAKRNALKRAQSRVENSGTQRRQDSPKVSVIVPTYNRPDMLVGTLRSILNQTMRDFEIIVINDAGVEVEGIVNHLNRDGRIVYVRHANNKGLAAARNTGIKLAQGKYIAYLDDDDVFYPDHLETLVTFLENNDEFKVAYTDAHRAHQVMEHERYTIVDRDTPYSYDFDYDAILVNNFVPVLCFMHEKSCLMEVGLFDENLSTHEDWDLWIRLSRRFKFHHIKKMTCEFSWRRDGTSMTSSKTDDFLRTARLIYAKHQDFSINKPHVRDAQRQALKAREAEAKISTLSLSSNEELSFQAVQSIHPEDPEVDSLLEKADTLTAAQCYDEALTGYQTILDIFPGNCRAMVGTGFVKLMTNKNTEAAIWFSKALNVSSANPKALCGLGLVRNAQDRPGEAFGLFCKALDADPENLKALHELVKLAYAMDRFREAAGHLEIYLMNHPGDTDILYSYAGILYMAGRRDEAREAVERLLALSPEYEGAQELLEEIGTRDSGLGTGTVAQPDEWQLKEEGKFEEALEAFSRLIDGGDRSSLADRGDCLAQLGRIDEAAASYQEALQEDETDMKAMVGLGVLSLLQGKQVKAVTWFNRVLKADPANGKALCGLGMVRNMQNKHGEAFDLFSRAADADPENLTPLHELVKLAYTTDRFQETEKRVERYLMHHPADLDMLYTLAGIQFKAGRNAEALAAIDKVLLFAPDYEGGKELRERIVESMAA